MEVFNRKCDCPIGEIIGGASIVEMGHYHIFVLTEAVTKLDPDVSRRP
jgi:hypothetical protein